MEGKRTNMTVFSSEEPKMVTEGDNVVIRNTYLNHFTIFSRASVIYIADVEATQPDITACFKFAKRYVIS